MLVDLIPLTGYVIILLFVAVCNVFGANSRSLKLVDSLYQRKSNGSFFYDAVSSSTEYIDAISFGFLYGNKSCYNPFGVNKLERVEKTEEKVESLDTATLFDMLVAILFVLFVGYLVLILRTYSLNVFHR
ncbi:MAG: hypothetical protein PHG06_05745 [Parabacteroides sp.]|nr:hypothetical protein [Parabacteroides sp.]